MTKAKRAKIIATLAEKWAPWEGTPETNERIERSGRTKRQRRHWPLERMYIAGRISDDEYLAGQEIAAVIEMIESAVNVRSSSLEARVDFEGSARDILIESLGRIRLEIAYTVWRKCLHKPPRLILDMITTNQPYVAIAKRHNVPWRTARRLLLTALRDWPKCRADANALCDAESMAEVYARLGEGQLRLPKPKDEE